MRCFYYPEIGDPGSVIELSERESKHLYQVLRANPGSEIRLLDGNGTLATAEIKEENVIVVSSRREVDPPNTRVHLFAASPRRQKMDQLITQCTEIGVWSITPVVTERSVALPHKKNTLARWETLAIEACKQSGNPFLPKINCPLSFEEAVEKVVEQKFNAYFGAVDDTDYTGNGVSTGQPPRSSSGVSAPTPNSNLRKDYAWFVGPEGGFTEAEQQLMTTSGFNGLNLGRWIMRTETAAVAGAVMLLKQVTD